MVGNITIILEEEDKIKLGQEFGYFAFGKPAARAFQPLLTHYVGGWTIIFSFAKGI